MSEQENEYSIEDKKFVSWGQRTLATIAIFIGICLLFYSYNFTKTDKINEHLATISAAVISLAGVLLLYLTLSEQRKAFTKERFENRLFELIKLHRANVDEFNIGDRVRGRKCFNQMVNEFRLIYKLVTVGKEFPEFKKTTFNTDEDVVDFAFKIFFFGVGYSSERQLKNFITNDEHVLFQKFIKPKLLEIQCAYVSYRRTNKEDYFEWWRPLVGEADEWTLELNYYPFDGHTSRLAHYYRHLYHSVKYIVSHSHEFEYKEIYGYLKMLRGQLSNQEQVLLYYNSLSDFGKVWHKKNYFTDFCFLKNLPLVLVNVKPHPHDKIGIVNKYGKKIFEADEYFQN